MASVRKESDKTGRGYVGNLSGQNGDQKQKNDNKNNFSSLSIASLLPEHQIHVDDPEFSDYSGKYAFQPQ